MIIGIVFLYRCRARGIELDTNNTFFSLSRNDLPVLLRCSCIINSPSLLSFKLKMIRQFGEGSADQIKSSNTGENFLGHAKGHLEGDTWMERGFPNIYDQ